jgi:primosomal replication protein N''
VSGIAAPGIQKWQRKRLQHQEFEQRLMAMKRERETRLAKVETFAEQQQLHKEITALEGRLRAVARRWIILNGCWRA